MSRPFLTAEWRNLFLATYAVPPSLLEARLPPGLALDTRDGHAFVSLVAFEFLNTRVLGVPWPGYRNFAELNLRFYVHRTLPTRAVERGVVFVREFVPQRLVAGMARWLYNEPHTPEESRAKLARKEKIPGFGHRVYRTEDPRATHLREMSRQLGEHTANLRWYELSRKVEEVVMEKKHLYANVDFYSASCYFTMGIPIDMFTPVFAVSRVSGWTAHILEQYADNRLIRPRAEYVGDKDVPYVPVERRERAAS